MLKSDRYRSPIIKIKVVSADRPNDSMVSRSVRCRDKDHGLPVCLLQSAQQANELIFRAEFEALAGKHAWFDYCPTVTRAADDDAWAGDRGRIDAERLRGPLADPASTRFYACGPGEFVRAQIELAGQLGIPSEHAHREQWG